MGGNRLTFAGGLLLLLAGGLLSFAPVYAARPSQPPIFQGTLYYVGLPLVIAGLALGAYGWMRGRRKG